MKKAIVLMILAALICSYAVPAYADVGEKLQTGLKNFVFAPKQVCDNVKAEVENTEGIPGKTFAAFGGFFKGLFYAIKDMTQGAYETFTFFVDHEDYQE